jgi:type I restriction enzyme S subunit
MSDELQKVKLGDLCEVIGGGTPSTENRDYWDGDIVWMSPKDLSANKDLYIFNSSSRITSLGLQKSAARMMPAGTILLSTRAPIGYMAIAGIELCTNQGFKSFVPNSKVTNSEFLFFLVKDKLEELKAVATGTTFMELSGSTLKNYALMIPTIEKQKQFKNATEALFDRIKYLQTESRKLTELKQLYLKKFFG